MAITELRQDMFQRKEMKMQREDRQHLQNML